MREILFRGKCVDTGEWVEGCLIYDEFCNTDTPYIGYLHLDDVECFEVILETVGQYTGLTDKNGKKIFEGDIVRGKFGTGIVNYNKGCFSVNGYQHKSYFNNPAIDVVMNEDFIEVIGNIYDNLELLEVTE